MKVRACEWALCAVSPGSPDLVCMLPLQGLLGCSRRICVTELGDEWHVCKTVLCVSLIVPCFLSPRLS